MTQCHEVIISLRLRSKHYEPLTSQRDIYNYHVLLLYNFWLYFFFMYESEALNHFHWEAQFLIINLIICRPGLDPLTLIQIYFNYSIQYSIEYYSINTKGILPIEVTSQVLSSTLGNMVRIAVMRMKMTKIHDLDSVHHCLATGA